MAYAPNLPVETQRLRLREFTRGDVDAVLLYRQRADVARHLLDEPMSRETVTEVVQRRVGQVALAEDGDRIFLAAELIETGQLIGEVSLILRSAVSRQGEIGYVFNPEFHGHGYATEAARALLGMGFEGAGLHRIYACCSVSNTASWHVMERLGMRREAHFHGHALFKGHWDEEFVYALLEDEWTARRDG